LYLYPAKPTYHPVSNDLINYNPQLEMLSLQSRVGVRIAGPNVLGAKVSGLVEGDFFATAEAYTHHLRVRHALMKMQWEKASLTMGQYWHPMFTPELFPLVVGFGAAAPFNPLNRAPQIRLDYTPMPSLKLMLAALANGYHAAVGPAEAQRNSGLPDLQFQLFLGNKPTFTTGITAGYMWLQPLEATAGTPAVKYYSEKLIGAYNFQWFAKTKISNLTLQTKVSYGQNFTQFVMIGGFGRLLEDAGKTTDFGYTNIKSYAAWFEAMYKINDKFDAGLFVGSLGALGADEKIETTGPFWNTRNADIANAIRLSPRITYTNKKMMFALEYMYSTADYGTPGNDGLSYNEYGVPQNLKRTLNHRILFATKYSF
jgi:hypothetical protein